jgi:hypothetical protein
MSWAEMTMPPPSARQHHRMVETINSLLWDASRHA